MIQRYAIVFILALVIGYWKHTSLDLMAGFISEASVRITVAYLITVLVSSIVIFLLGGVFRVLKNMNNRVQNELNETDKEIDFKGKAFSKYVFYTAIVVFFLFLSDSCEIL